MKEILSFIESVKRGVFNLLLRLNGNIFYINGPETLPPPLTKSEEEELLRRIENNDETAREPLIVRNLRLVVYIARKFENSGTNIEDLISIGTIGLIKAVNTFRPEKKIKLATYASRCIENEILMYLRKVSMKRGEISIDEPLNIDWDGNELLLSDVLGSDENAVSMDMEAEDERRLLCTLINNLKSREKVIMEMRFGLNGYDEHTQKEVADILGISQSYISRLEKRIIDSLRREFSQSVQT